MGKLLFSLCDYYYSHLCLLEIRNAPPKGENKPFPALASWKTRTANFSPVLSTCPYARFIPDSPRVLQFHKAGVVGRPVQCASPDAGPVALGLPCSLAQWQAAHKTNTWIKDSACGYTQQDPRSITSVLNNLLLVLQRKWRVHYWVIKTHFIRKIYTIYIFDIGFQRVTQSYRRAYKKGSNSSTWETSRFLHTDRQLLLNCEGVMDGNEKNWVRERQERV